MSSLSDDPTSDDGQFTEPLAVVEATLDDGGNVDEPEVATVVESTSGNSDSDESPSREQPQEDSASDESQTSDQPPSTERVVSLLPKRGRPPRAPPHPPKASRPRGRPPLGSLGPRMPAPASDTHKSMLQMPKTYYNKSNSTTAPVTSPNSTPVGEPATPPDPPRPRRGRPSLASQTPRMPGPASEFYRALVDMHDCLKWDRKVLYRYERHPAPSNAVAADTSANPQVPTGSIGNSDKNSTPAQLNNERSEPMATDAEVKEEPVQDLGEENNVAIEASFSLTPAEELPSICSETSSMRDKDDSPGNAPDRGKTDKSSKVSVGAASVATYYLLGTSRGLNRKYRRCVVPSCLRPLDPHFSFPKDKNLCLKWLLAIPKGSWSLNELSVVCARHFDRMDINWKTRMANSVTLTVDAVPKLYLHSPATPHGIIHATTPTSVNKNAAAVAVPAVSSVAPSAADSSAKSSTGDSPTADGSVTESMADISETQDVSLVQQGNGVFKIQMGDDDSESDLEIIEPHIETYEVSDTSDEGESAENKGDKDVTTGAKDGKNNTPISIVGIKSRKDVSSTGQLFNRRVDGNIIKCCVPRCGSYTGSPPGVGFHTFPIVGETRLSVRSLDNSVTVHDLCSMWKSLLSVPNLTEDSYVCTRHFTVNDYIYNTLNKAAVPTQFLPTPVMFAPCRVEKSVVARPPPLVLVRNPLQQQPTRQLSTIRIRAPTILRGAPRIGSSPSALSQIQSRIVNHVLTVGQTSRAQVPGTLRVMSSLPRTAPGSTTTTSVTSALHPPLPKPAVMRLGCAIPDCPNKTYEDGNKPIFFRLPTGIEKCKEWVYSCGHPEWLDKGMFFARAKFRICAEHFPDEMFLGSDRKMLKGFAKPCIKVQEPYKKCIVKSCHNYYDKERLHHIGVDFSPFPDREKAEKRLIKWIHAVKNSDDDPAEEELKKYENSVICSLHFRNSDYIAGPVGKRLSHSAVPSMNLVVKEPLHTDDNEDQEEEEEVELEKPKRKRLRLSAKRKSMRAKGRMLAQRWRKLKEEKEKALAEGRPWPPVDEEKEAKEKELEAERAKIREEKALKRLKRWESLSEADKKRYSRKGSGLRLSAAPKKRKFFGRRVAKGIECEPKEPEKRKQPVDEGTDQAEESKRQKLGDDQSEGDSQHGNEGPGSSHGKGQGRCRKTRSRRGDSEDSSEDESVNGSWASENEGRQLRFGRKARPLRHAVLSSSKRSKYDDSEEGESSGSGCRGRKQRRLEEETIYTQAPITRASARAAAAKNKKIYAEDSDSDNQQEDYDNDRGVPDEDDNARQEFGRPQGTHFLDPDFGGLEDMAMDSMDTLENCLETILVEQSHDSLGPPDLGPPEKKEIDQGKDESPKETKDPEVSEKNPDVSEKNQDVSEKNLDVSSEKDQLSVEVVSEGNQIETEAVEGRQLRFGRKARAVPQYTKRKRRGRRGRSNVTASEEADPEADDSARNNSGEVNKSLQPVGDVENTNCRVPASAVVEEDSEQQSAKKGGRTNEPMAESGEDVRDVPEQLLAVGDKRRGRRGRSNVTAAEEDVPQADDSSRNNSEEVDQLLPPVGDVGNTDCTSAAVEEGSKQQASEKGDSTPETVAEAGADLSVEDVPERPPAFSGNLRQKDNPDEAPSKQDAEASPQKSRSEVPNPPTDETNPSPGEKPPKSPHSDGSHPPQDDSKENDDTNCVPYGPKMAVPTQADVEFFRSIIPTMAKFNQHQRAVLKASVLSTLKDMLGEDTGIKLNTTEALLNALPLPASPE